MPRQNRSFRAYTFYVPDDPEYARLNKILEGPVYPGGIRDRSRFVREVLQDALGLSERPWRKALVAGADGKPASYLDRDPEPEMNETPAQVQENRGHIGSTGAALDPEMEDLLASGLAGLEEMEGQ